MIAYNYQKVENNIVTLKYLILASLKRFNNVLVYLPNSILIFDIHKNTIQLIQ